MKKSLLYMLISASVLTSCKKEFTELNPESARNTGNFYKTASDMEIATNAIYKVLQSNGAFNQGYWIMGEMRSDNTDAGGDITGLGAELNNIDNFAENAATAEPITTAYLESYLGVNRANIVLDRIDAIPMDENLKNRLKGEALFLRSVFYYHIAVFFGKAPLVLKEINQVEGKTYPQVSATEILKQVATDLTAAENYLPSINTGVNVGRANKAGAAALLGKVYLTLGDKASAVAPLRRVLANTNYGLVLNYANIWGIANKNNKESLFEIQFKGGGTNTGNAFTHAFSALLPQQTGAYKNRPTEEMENAYEAGDLRRDASMHIPGDTRFGTTGLNSRYIIKYGTSTSFLAGDADENWIFLRYSDAMLMLAEALGEGTEAYGLINEVRRRAGLTLNISASTPGTFADKLLKERRVELAFENHRWPDLLRFGKATEFLTAQGKKPRLLFLIPQRELDINRSYSQNPL
jgi:hypothetical protein